MAGPSVMVRIMGDVTNLAQSMKSVGSTAASAANAAREGFSGLVSTLNKTGILGPFGEAFAGIDEAIGKVVEHGKSIGPAMIGVGGALAGVGAGLAALGSKDQAAHQQLQQAIENTGKSYDDYAGQVDKAIKHQEKFGDTASQTQNALQTLTQATGDPAKALQLLGEATDLAAAKHESLDAAAVSLGKVYNGNTKVLKEFGIEAQKSADTTAKVEAATKTAAAADAAAVTAKQHLADVHALLSGKTKLTTAETITLRDAQQKVVTATDTATAAHKKLADMHAVVISKTQAAGDNVTALGEKLKGQGAAAADTFTGRLDAMKAKIEDSAAAFGQKYGPALTAAGTAMTAMGAAWQVATGIKEALTVATDAGTAADTAAATAEYVALGPILLIIAAVAVLGVALYELITHWSTVWGAAKEAVKAVWDWISVNWPLLLSIILGPITAAAYQIYKHWSDIKAGAADVVNYITGIWNGLVGFFTGIPGRLAGIWSSMWGGMKEAFRAVINGMIDLWNALHFTLPKIDLGPLGKIGGGDIGVPAIPHMASGGIVNSPTLAMIGESGPEAVVPLGKGVGGPAVHIEHASFSSEVDVDMLMRKAEFAVSAGRL
jgi:hypothetical protein